jgi:NADH-ubiquinone oxidoreductase chain 4
MTALTCTRQPDLKSLIAYSSVAHIALLTAGAISNTLWGWEGALVIILAHGLARSALFAIANTTYETTQTRSLFLTKGLLSLFPAITIWWFIIIAANLGAPPSINLIRELLLLTSILSISSYLSIPIALISFFAATYCLILFTSTQHGPIPTLSNPISIQHNRTHLLIILHATPLFILILKSSLISLWLWFCSWQNNIGLQTQKRLKPKSKPIKFILFNTLTKYL